LDVEAEAESESVSVLEQEWVGMEVGAGVSYKKTFHKFSNSIFDFKLISV
jgi:hypothetical protein